MKRLTVGLVIALSTMPSQAQAPDKARLDGLWAAFNGCVFIHEANIARTVVSLSEGADLLHTGVSLCARQYGELVIALSDKMSMQYNWEADRANQFVREMLTNSTKEGLYVQKLILEGQRNE